MTKDFDHPRPPRRRGPAPTAGTQDRKSTISVRISPALKDNLVDATKTNDRSLSQEAEMRLERSFRDDEIMAALADIRARLA